MQKRASYLLLVLVLSVFITLPWLDRPFHTRGEPREALVAQSMLVTHNWISPPAYNGAVPSKPPFNHWLIALASLPGGEVTETTARLPSALAIIVFSLAFYLFLARRIGDDTALLAVLILLSSFEWFRSSVTCRVDVLLSTSMAGGLLALFSWRESGRRRFPIVAAILISCAALTKGPIGIALPIFIFALFELCSVSVINFKEICAVALRAVMITLPVLAITSIWYVAGYIQRGAPFIERIRYENLHRLAGTMADEPHKHGVAYMFLMLALGVLPWTIVWITAGATSLIKKGVAWLAVKRAFVDGDALHKFALIAALVIFIFFCIPASKRSVYILPAYPFFAILAARSCALWSGATRKLIDGLSKWLIYIGLFLVGVFIIGGVFELHPQVEQLMTSFSLGLSWFRLVILFALLGCMIYLAGYVRALSPAHKLGVRLIVVAMMINFFILEPVFYRLSPRDWLLSQRLFDPSKYERIYSYGSEAYAASFYLKKQFFSAQSKLDVGSIVFVEQRNLDSFKQKIGTDFKELGRFSSGLEPEKRDVVIIEVL